MWDNVRKSQNKCSNDLLLRPIPGGEVYLKM